MRVDFHPEAEVEFIEEAVFYEDQVPSLGSAFIAEVELAVAILEEYPELGAEFDSPFRYLPMRRFPHSLIYAVESHCIWIVAVAHQRRRPGYWRDRQDR